MKPSFQFGEKLKCTLKKHRKLYVDGYLYVEGAPIKGSVLCRDLKGSTARIRTSNLLQLPDMHCPEETNLYTGVVTIKEASLKGICGPIQATSTAKPITNSPDSYLVDFNLESSDQKFKGHFSIPSAGSLGWKYESVCGDYDYVIDTKFTPMQKTTVRASISIGGRVNICIFNYGEDDTFFHCKFDVPKQVENLINKK